jgi:heme-degrading monooxygenase HmoA
VVTVGLYYDVIPEKSPLFVAKFREVLGLLERLPGHRSSFLYQRVDDPDSFAIISEWDDPEAFHKFLGSEEFRRTTDWGREQILRGAPRHKVYPRADDLGRPSRPA